MHLRRLIEPFEPIGSVVGFERFLNFSKTDRTGRLLTRNKVVAIFTDTDEYEELIENFKSVSRQTYWREDTEYGLVTKSDIAREIFKKYGRKFFLNDFDKNTIFFLKMKNRFARREQLTIMNFDKTRDLQAWLAKSSISPLEEMTQLNQMSFSTKSPLLVAFVDPQAESTTQAYLDELEHLGTKYINRVNFVWVDYRDNLSLMRRLGVEGCKLPCIGFESPRGISKTFIITPSRINESPTMKDIDTFLEDFFAGKLRENKKPMLDAALQLAEQETRLLNNTRPLDLQEYYAALYDTSMDKALYFYNSSSQSPRQTARSTMFNYLAHFVRQRMKWPTVLMASIDIAVNRLPEEFFSDPAFETNSLYFVPSSQQKGPFLKLADKDPEGRDVWEAAERILKFLLVYADYKYESEGQILFTHEDDRFFKNKLEIFSKGEPVNTDLFEEFETLTYKNKTKEEREKLKEKLREDL